jgi:CRP/FNR family transcriptional regulator
MHSKEKSKFFKNLSPFASLTRSELDTLVSKSYKKKFDKNQFLFQEGDDPKGLFFVKQGHVALLKQAPTGKNLIVKVVTPGEFCGEVGVFNNIPYIATAQALVDTELYVISREDLLSFIQSHPEVIPKLIGMSVRKIIEAFTMIDGLGNKDLKQRIAFTLLKLAEKIGEGDSGHIILSVPISRQHLAEMVGSTQESVSRIMASLKRQDVLKSVRRKIVILNYEKLREIAEEVEE